MANELSKSACPFCGCYVGQRASETTTFDVVTEHRAACRRLEAEGWEFICSTGDGSFDRRIYARNGWRELRMLEWSRPTGKACDYCDGTGSIGSGRAGDPIEKCHVCRRTPEAQTRWACDHKPRCPSEHEHKIQGAYEAQRTDKPLAIRRATDDRLDPKDGPCLVSIHYFKPTSGKWYCEDEDVEWKTAVCLDTPLGFPHSSPGDMSKWSKPRSETATLLDDLRKMQRHHALVWEEAEIVKGGPLATSLSWAAWRDKLFAENLTELIEKHASGLTWTTSAETALPAEVVDFDLDARTVTMRYETEADVRRVASGLTGSDGRKP